MTTQLVSEFISVRKALDEYRQNKMGKENRKSMHEEKTLFINVYSLDFRYVKHNA